MGGSFWEKDSFKLWLIMLFWESPSSFLILCTEFVKRGETIKGWKLFNGGYQLRKYYRFLSDTTASSKNNFLLLFVRHLLRLFANFFFEMGR